ncbi:hypothetical protein BU24DRAFT_6719 [Aaosphaeria arxii CBS 175.79]|uniref:Zn(2)-C6 fungal-type domain-containing protein n=1 Tax=Aaosphaeria arxii CBS 175.79 TaxID=1450172 RepID=A0A6A5Y7B3_9PLEO|nr:uncharacterized protein BU24DRAFT_6719 [Aaosphaeria arxii CBS 175.79]KAF2020690.1 hypothetical protein BU24DRAFT_6719 [Aaosphaeria arxii CBS 175.79]
MDNNIDNFDAFYGFDPSYDPNRHPLFLNHHHHQTWPLPLSPSQQMASHDPNAQQSSQQQHHNNQHQRRINTVAASTAATSLPTTTSAIAPLQTSGLGFSTSLQTANPMLADWMGMPPNAFTHQAYGLDMTMNPSDFTQFGGQLQTSPVEFPINTTQAMLTSMSMDAPAFSNLMTSASMGLANMAAMTSTHSSGLGMADINQEIDIFPGSHQDFTGTTSTSSNSVNLDSPGEQWLEVRSLSSSDNGWTAVDFGGHRNSYDFTPESAIIFNPAQALHIRTNSDSSNSNQSDVPRSAGSFSSFEEIHFPMNSPGSENDNSLELVHSHHSHSSNCYHGLAQPDADQYGNQISPNQSVSPPAARVEPVVVKQSTSNTTSPSSSAVSSPPTRRRKSPTTGAKPAKTIVKKTPAHSTKKDVVGEKRIGRRRGPLRPDQRQQAHEIRKLRACLRCKFLKKTCDKGDPCGGCQPSHARLWQVPCTRIDIKDIAYFMKDWKADYERHVSLGFSVGNIKGFSPQERPIYVTHGYGHYLPIMAREVYVRDEKCFGVDWVETLHGLHFEMNTAKLSAGMEGISHSMLSDYLDRHIDGGFEQFVDEYFEGTYFLTELLKTAYRFYCREKLPVIRKALKLVLAYNLTLHVTMVEGLPDDECNLGKVDDQQSKFCGKTIAPVMINFQVKCALADMWRELQKDVLEELSALYSSVYSGDKLKNWPTIFMLAAILLAVWELIQFDCNYRVPDQAAVNKFTGEMEGTPVGVIVGLFSAISQKLPAFTEWDTRKHHHLLNSNPAVCDAMTEVRAHVTKYESYLRSRSDCKFDRSDFDSLSNKFLSKLVIRAN